MVWPLRAYDRLQGPVDHVLLGLLWFVCSLPLITVIPATSALYASVRERRGGRYGGNLWRRYAYHFRQNLAASAILQLVLTVVLVAVWANLLIASSLTPGPSVVLTTIALAIGIGVALAAVHAVCLMAVYELPPQRLFGLAGLLIVARPGHTVRCAGVIGLAGVVGYFCPPALVAVVPATAALHTFWAEQVCQKIQVVGVTAR